MNRRKFIGLSLGSTAGAILGYGYLSMNQFQEDDLNDLDAAIKLLREVAQSSMSSSGLWQPVQIFTHLAQSIEYSMTGYPEHKSELFKSTVGQWAFSFFESRKAMTHSLSEPIPGAPELISTGHLEGAVVRLIDAITAFNNNQGDLREHFAYGKLDHSQYGLAHVMHINQHLSEIRFQS